MNGYVQIGENDDEKCFNGYGSVTRKRYFVEQFG